MHLETPRPLSLDLEPAIERVTACLAEVGFGVMSRIDVHAALKKKLDVDHEPTVILGACNPKLAHRGFQEDPRFVLAVPCNVVVRQAGPGAVEVAMVDPVKLLAADDMTANEVLSGIAAEAHDCLAKAAAAL